MISRLRSLSAEQRAGVNRIREQWCAAPPVFADASEETACDVGLRCGATRTATLTERVLVPCEQLPPELAALLEAIPSPRPE